MLAGEIIDTVKLPNDRYIALDNLGFQDTWTAKHKSLLYRSQTVQDVGLYNVNSNRNLQGAKRFFMDKIKRHNRVIVGNSFYRSFKAGIYPEVVVWDMKAYYPTLFEQICNHIDESYFGKELPVSESNKAMHEMASQGTNLTLSASMKPFVDIGDIAKNAVKIDCGDHREFVDKVSKLSKANFIDEMDKRVAKITRNAMVYGFGAQNKNALTSNISALTMFFGREILRHLIEELPEGIKPCFSMTDSIHIPHINTRDLDQAIRTASGLVDNEFFGNTEIISLGLANMGLKTKFEEEIVFNQTSYLGSLIKPQGRRGITIKVAGLHSPSSCSMGETQQGKSIQETLNANYAELFSIDKQIPNENKDYLYGLLQHRLTDEYEARLENMWRNNDNRIYNKAVCISQTVKVLNHLKGNLNGIH